MFALQSRRQKKCSNQSNARNNQGQFPSGEITAGPQRTSVTAVCSFWCLPCFRMSYRANYSPLLSTHTPPLQSCYKACDVANSSGMKGQTLLGKGDIVDQPGKSVPAPKAHLWPDPAEEIPVMERLLKKCQIRNKLVRECLAECLGVYILIVSIFYRYDLKVG